MASTTTNQYSFENEEKTSDVWDYGNLQDYLETGKEFVSPLSDYGHSKYSYQGHEQTPPTHKEHRPDPEKRSKFERSQMLKSMNDYLPESAHPTDYPFGNWDFDLKNKDSASIRDVSISDLFGLKYPRDLLPENSSSQSQQNQSYFRHHERGQSNVRHYQVNEDYGQSQTVTPPDVPSTPPSLNASRSPSTPDSFYSNSCVYSNQNNFSQTDSYDSSPPPMSKKSHFAPCRSVSSFPISNRSTCHGRAIRGSPTSSDGSTDFCRTPGFRSSRSNSPDSDSEYHNQTIDHGISDLVSNMSLSSHDYNRCMHAMSKKHQPHSYHGRQYSHQSHCRSSCCHSPLRLPKSPYLPPEDYYCSKFDQQSMCSNFPSSNNSYAESQILERASVCQRNAAGKPTFNWEGELPLRNPKPAGYSSKVFIGGCPYDITEQALIHAFKQFGLIGVDWPGKGGEVETPKGFAYIILESEKHVRTLLSCCTRDFAQGGTYHYKISSKRQKSKRVEVIPWGLNESNDIKSSSQKLDPFKTIFVGALHGMLTAPALTKIMDDLFGGVVYTGIDTDKYKYPIGSARVTFNNLGSYMKAVSAAFVGIKTSKFSKTVQVDPYLEDSMCNLCKVQQGPYFCRDMMCFQYFCRSCWVVHHREFKLNHKPLSRGSKNNQLIDFSTKGDMKCNDYQWQRACKTRFMKNAMI